MSIRSLNRRAVSRQTENSLEPNRRRARRYFLSQLAKLKPRRLQIETLDERRVLATMYASDDLNNLLTFDSATPGTIASNVAITGLGAGEVIQGLDIRPATGQLYAIGITDLGTTRSGRILTINPTTAVATPVGAAFSTTLPDFPYFGFDFNPLVDRIRVTTASGDNLRVNPNDGSLVAADTNLSVIGSDSVAYDRINGSAGLTTLYTYNFTANQLATIGGVDGSPSPNLGVVTNVGPSGITADPGSSQQFDIEAVTNIARLATFVGGTQRLYTINLATGAATLVGTIGGGTNNLRGLTTASPNAFLNGTVGADTISIVRSGSNVVATGVVGGATVTFPLAALNSIVVNGLDAADTITVDYSGGNFGIPVTVNGGNPITSPGDRLRTVGGNFTTGTSNPTNGHDGALVYAGGTTGAATLNYTGLEPIDDLNVVTNYTINATNGLNFINVVNGPVVLGAQTTQVNDGAVLFELVNFANKTNVTINALDGSDQIAINNSLKGVGLTTLIVNAGNGDDQFNISGPGIVAGVGYTFNGGNDNDLFSISGSLLGAAININGDAHTGLTPATQDRLTVNSFASDVTQSATQLQFSGGSPITFGTLEQINLNNLNTLSVTGTAAADAITLSKPTTTTYRSILNSGIEVNFDAPLATVGAQYFANTSDGSDSLTVSNTGRVVNLRAAFNAGLGTNDTLNVFGNPGTPVARESYITGATEDQGRVVLDPDGNLGYLKTSAAVANGDELDVSFNGLDPINTDVPAVIYDIVLSAVADTGTLSQDGVPLNGAQSMLLTDNSATFETTRFANKATTTISGFSGADSIIWNNNGNISAGLTALQFFGFLPVGLGVDDAPASNTNRDVVTVNDTTAAALNVGFNYSNTASVVNVTGLAVPLQIGTAETVRYNGGGNDNTTVTGSVANADLITAVPISPTRAIVFNGGNPFDGPPEVFNTSRPGIAGGSTSPDLDLNGIVTATGLNIQDNGITTGDRLYVYGESDAGLGDGSGVNNPFGFGAGLLLPAVGVGNAFDVITSNQSSTVVNNYVVVNYDSADFVQALPNVTPAIVINSGSEANPAPTAGTDPADQISLTLSSAYKFQVNGGDPDPATTGIVPPDGDSLNIAGTFPVINVFSTKNPGGAPVVSFEFPGSNNLGFSYSSIENLGPYSAATVNLIGDNNNPAVDQNDNFVVVGRDVDSTLAGGDFDGTNEFSLRINGSQPINFSGVQFLHAFGDDQNPPPGTPSVGNDIDTLEVTPYADDTPRGWGIDVSFNEGNPSGTDGAQQDLLILHTSLFGGQVSENIVIKPSGTEDGEVVVTNASFGTPIVDIDFVANTDIIIRDDDGFLNDTDTVTLLGTNPNTSQLSGNETFTFNADANMTVAQPLVTVVDSQTPANVLYRLREYSTTANPAGFFLDSLTINGLAGNDTINLIGGNTTQQDKQFNFYGGEGDDHLSIDMPNGFMFDGTGLFFDGGSGVDSMTTGNSAALNNAVTTATYSVGGAVGSGQLTYDDGFSADMVVDFVNLEPVVDLVVAANLIVSANAADNAINYSVGGVVGSGLVSIDDHESIEFTNKTQLTIDAQAGSDTINLNNPNTPTGLTTITVNAGDPTGSDTLILNGRPGFQDQIRLLPTAAGAGSITQTGVPARNYTGIEHIRAVMDPLASDHLSVDGTVNNDTFRIASGPATGEMTITGEMNGVGGAAFLLPTIYVTGQSSALIGTFNFNGVGGADTMVVTGTSTNDVFNFSRATATSGSIDHDVNGVQTNFIGFANLTRLIVEGGDGNDLFAVPGNFPTILQINGGNPTSGSDILRVTGVNATAETFTVTPTFDPGSGNVVVNTATTNYTGIEHIQLFGLNTDQDNLIVNDDGRDNVWTVGAGANLDDLIQIAGRESIDFENFNNITLNNTFGTDTFNVYPTNMVEVIGTLIINGDATAPIDDQVNLYGTVGNDLVTSTAAAMNFNGTSITVGTNIRDLRLLMLAGADNVDLDLDLPGTAVTQKYVDGGDGDDIINLSGTVDATILGGAGDDFLTGSPAYDYIDGGAGNDFLFGLAGNDDLYGGDGSDLIVGGGGADRMFGQTGADVLVWNPGDGSDLFEGGDGIDILQFVGAAGTDNFTLTANGGRLRFDRAQGNIVIDAGGMEQVDVNSSISFGGILSGANVVPAVVTAATGQAALVFNSVTNTFELEVVVQGLTQAQVTASSINLGAPGVNGAVAFDLGTGTAWSDAGGSLRRTVNLGAFPAANVAALLSGGTYIQVTTTGNTNDIRAQLTAVSGAPNLNGADTFTINDLSPTEVQVINLGLGVADAAAADTVTINGRNVADNINLNSSTVTRVAVTGLAYDVNVDNALAADGDILVVNANDGNDTITSPLSLLAFFTNANLRLNGGLGNDNILGNGATLTGNEGDDFLTGGANNDFMDGSAGDDTFVGGGGTDNVGGGAGSSVGDTILVAGTSGADTVALSLSATGQLIATVNGATTTYGNFVGGAVSTSGIEQVLVQTQNGNDNLTVNSANGAIPMLVTYDGGANNDLLTLIGGTATADTYSVGPELSRGTSVIVIAGVTQQVSFINIEPVIDLVAGPLLVLGTNANNNITYTQGPNVGAPVANTGLVAIDGFETIEFGNKTALSINALLGNDTVTLANTGVAAPTGLTQIVVSGGAGDDVIDASTSTVATPLRLYGGVGNDTLVGGLGGDLLYGEQGNDTLVDSPGNDAFDGGNNGLLPAVFAFPALPVGVTLPAATSDPITATGGFDTLVIRGTGGNDVLAATQGTATAVVGAGYPLAIVNSAGGAIPAATADVITTVGGADVPNAVASRPSVEVVRIEAGAGNDEIIVAHADSYVAATGTGAAPVLAAGAVPQQMVRYDVQGDAPSSSDRLTVQDLGAGDLVLLRQAVDQRTGRVTVAPAVNTTTLGGFNGDVVYTGIAKVNITPINPLNGGTGTDGLGQVVVFDTDPFEYNDNILNAEDIAHLELVTRNPNIDPGHNAALPVVTPAGNGDEDWYAFTATQNGTFTINTLFSVVPVAQPAIPGTRPGLPGNGQLTSAVYNKIGAATAPLVVGSTLLGPQGNAIGQQLQFTGVKGVTYYLRVIGTNATPNGLPAVGSVSTSLSVNTYDITLTQVDNLGPQVFDPDGTNFPAQAIQIVDAPLYNLFDNKQTFNSTVLAAPAPSQAGGIVSFNSEFNLVGMHIGETVTFSTGVNAGLSDTITAISGNRLTFGSNANPSIFALPAVGDAFYVGAPTPTPNVNGLTINFRDPITAAQFGVAPGALLGALDPATALNPGNYILRGDANGIIPIQNVRFAVPANGVIGGLVLAPTATALNTTISLNAGAGLSVANGAIVGQTLQFTSGPNTGLFGRITGYNALTGSLRFSSAFPVAVTAGDAFIIIPSPIVISPVPVLTTANVTAASTNVVINLGVTATTGAGLSTVPGTYVGQALQVISGGIAGETRTITAYNGAGVFTVAGGVVANGFSVAPAIGDLVNIVGTPATATSTVASVSLANSIVGGAGLPTVNGSLVGQALQFTSGPLSGQSRVITGYTIVPGIGPVFAFATGFTAAPAVGNSFVIVPAAPAPLANAVQAVFAGQGRFAGGLGGVSGAGLSQVPQAYLGQVLQFTSGALTGQAQVITDYANSIFAFSQPFTGNPAVGDTFVILPVNVTAITLDFESPLPDDRYTLTVSDEIRDAAGNRLDGNSGATQPTGSPVFPSGDGISGGNFSARFTVDSRPELGTWAAGSLWADINGNQLFDPNNTDFTNRDYAYLLGYTSDELFAGNFADVGATFADGFDKIAAYGRVGSSTWRWLIDTDNDGIPNITQIDPASINGFPVSGDFDLNTPGDEVGLFTGTTWFLDINHNFILNDGALGVRQLPWTRNGVQVNGSGFTGDFDGDGAVDLGSWSNDVFSLSLSSASGGVVDGAIDTQFSFGFPGNRERPVAADMNRDGIDDIGLWVPDRATQNPGEAAEWYWLISGLVTNDTQLPGGLPPFPATLGPTIPERVVADPVAVPGRNIVAFTPTPFGNDLYMQFGDEFSLPIVGNFDPPVAKASTTPTSPLTNIHNPLDVNNDGKITAFDALAVINQLNLAGGPTSVPTGGFIRAPFLDVDGNSSVSAFDALQVINYLNLHPNGSAGEFVFENGLVGREDTSGVDEELLLLLAADEDRE